MRKNVLTVHAGDAKYENLMRSIHQGKQPFKYIDYLYISHASLNAADKTLHYPKTIGPKVRTICTIARQQNPKIVLAAFAGPMEEFDSLKTPADLAAFSASLPAFLKAWGLHGLNVGWESCPRENGAEWGSQLLAAVRAAVGPGVLLSITADSAEGLDAAVVNACVDVVNIQSYNRVDIVSDFVNAGIEGARICVGMDTENENSAHFYPPGGGISEYTNKCLEIGGAGLYAWRLDDDDTHHAARVPRYTILQQMWQFTHGSMAEDIGGALFDDSCAGRSARGNPTAIATPITQIVIRADEVVHGLQAANGRLEMPHHGGYSGQEHVLTPEPGDPITGITGCTGLWRGRICVLQVAFTTRDGRRFGPYGSKANSSAWESFAVNAPVGQSIVAFSGSLTNVPLCDGSVTTVLTSLGAAFA